MKYMIILKMCPQNIKKMPSKVAHNPTRPTVFSPASFALCNWDSFIVWKSLKLSNFAGWKNSLEFLGCRYNSIPIYSTQLPILSYMIRWDMHFDMSLRLKDFWTKTTWEQESICPRWMWQNFKIFPFMNTWNMLFFLFINWNF